MKEIGTRVEIGESVWAPTYPLIVMERCTALQFVTWLALRWLTEAFPDREGFGIREIAERAKVSRATAARCIQGLIDLGFLIERGEQQTNFPQPRKVYDLPLQQLATESSSTVSDIVADWRLRYNYPKKPDLCLSQRHEKCTTDSCLSQRHSHVSHRDIGQADTSTPKTSNEADTDPAHVSHRDIAMSLTETDSNERTNERTNDHARARKSKKGRPRAIPPNPDHRPKLASHPLDLWKKVAQQYRPVHDDELTRLAELIERQVGFGWHWVGEAIHVAAAIEDQRGLGGVNITVNRWLADKSWGTPPAPKEQTNARSGSSRSRSVGSGRGRVAAQDNGKRPVNVPKPTYSDLDTYREYTPEEAAAIVAAERARRNGESAE